MTEREKTKPRNDVVKELINSDVQKFYEWPNELHTIDPVRHGKWISVPHKKARICSECYSDEPYKFADEDADVFDYCPHCGIKMDAKEVWR